MTVEILEALIKSDSDQDRRIRELESREQNTVGLRQRRARDISGGAVTVDALVIELNAETGSTDDLDTLDGGTEGRVVILCAATGDTITVKDAADNIELAQGDFSMNADDLGIMLRYSADDSNWYEVCRNYINTTGSVTDHGLLLGLGDDDHSQYFLLAGRAGGQTAYGGNAASDDLFLRSTSDATKGDIVMADSGGNVGVGGSPSALFHIQGGVDEVLRLQAGATDDPTITWYQSTNRRAGLRYDDAEDDLIFDIAGVDKLWVSAGSVGVGVAPSVPLHVYGTTEIVRIQDSSATGNPALTFYQGGTLRGTLEFLDSGDLFNVSSDVGNITLSPVDTEVMRLNTSGNVGIGNSLGGTVSAPVHIMYPSMELRIADASATGDPMLTFYQSTTAKGRIKYYDSIDALVYYINGSEYVTMTNSGLGIGIGVAAPSQPLHVSNAGTMARFEDPSATGNPLVEFTQSTSEVIKMGYYDADAAFSVEVENSGNRSLYVNSSGQLGVNVIPDNALVIRQDETATLTDITQGIAKSGVLIDTDYTGDSYVGGLIWRAADNNPTKPKAGIWMRETGAGTQMFFGVSDNYGAGITLTGITIDEDGYVGINDTDPSTQFCIDAGTGIHEFGDGWLRMSDHPTANKIPYIAWHETDGGTRAGYLGYGDTTAPAIYFVLENSYYLAATGNWGLWVDVTGSYATGWLDYGAPYEVGRYKKVADMVYLEGLVKTTTGVTATIFTLPVGYRPQNQQIFIVQGFDSSAATQKDQRITITNAGTVSASGAWTMSTGDWISLSGIAFSVA